MCPIKGDRVYCIIVSLININRTQSRLCLLCYRTQRAYLQGNDRPLSLPQSVICSDSWSPRSQRKSVDLQCVSQCASKFKIAQDNPDIDGAWKLWPNNTRVIKLKIVVSVNITQDYDASRTSILICNQQNFKTFKCALCVHEQEITNLWTVFIFVAKWLRHTVVE